MTDSFTPPSDDSKPPRRTYQFDSAGWRREALRSTVLTDAAKVLAAVMADRLRPDGSVSVPRAEMADLCACSDRQISERLKQLVETRFLDRISTGKRGHTAIYKALHPGVSARLDRTLPDLKRAVSPDAFTTAEPRAFSEPLSVSTPLKRAAEPRTSSRAEVQTKPRRERVPVGSSSALPSLQEVDPTQNQRRDGAETVRAPVRLRLVVAEECSHGDPHPELCAFCERERKQAS